MLEKFKKPLENRAKERKIRQAKEKQYSKQIDHFLNEKHEK